MVRLSADLWDINKTYMNLLLTNRAGAFSAQAVIILLAAGITLQRDLYGSASIRMD